jgi:drug/metabolite transporter (DMT)-like permease
VALVLLSVLLLSFRGILTKLAFAENVALMDLFYFRFLIAIPLMWAFALYKFKRKAFDVFSLHVAVNCLLAGFVGYYLATLADLLSLELIDANINRVILYSFPIYVLMWNSLLERKLPNSRYIVAFLAIQLSLYFLLGGFDVSLIVMNGEGALWALAAAVSYSIYVIINQETGKKVGSVLFTTYSVTFSFLFINMHYLVTESVSLGGISNKGWLVIILIAVLCTALPLLLFSEGIKQVGASRASLISMSGPVLTVILAYLLLNETLSFQQVIGVVGVICTLALLERRKKA